MSLAAIFRRRRKAATPYTPVATALRWIDSAPTLHAFGVNGHSRAQVVDQRGAVFVPQPSITYTSGTTATATIDSTGALTAVANGTSLLTAASSGLTSITQTVTVSQTVAQITGVPTSISEADNAASTTLTPTYKDANGNVVSGATGTLTSDQPSIMSVSGLTATPQSAGTTTLRLVANPGAFEFDIAITLTVPSGGGAVTGLTATLQTDQSVALAWTDAPGASTNTITRDGTTIGTVAQGHQAFRTNIGGGDPAAPRYTLPVGWSYVAGNTGVRGTAFHTTWTWNTLPGESGLILDPSAYGANVHTLTDSGNRDTNNTNLQNAINTAYTTAGHTIIYLDGGEWASSYTAQHEIQIPAPSGANNGTYWCVVADKRLDPAKGVAFPRASGKRIQSGDESGMPTMSVSAAAGTGNTLVGSVWTGGRPLSAFNLAAGVRNFATVGIHYQYDSLYDPGSATDGAHTGMNDGFIAMRFTVTQASDYPSMVVVDRCSLHSTVGKAMERALFFGGHSIAVTNNNISHVGTAYNDSQCFLSTTGAGPYLIQNNYLGSGYGECVHFGGGDDHFDTEVPSDIAIVGNHFDFELAMHTAGYTTKNLFEVKTARRVLFTGNYGEHYIGDGEQFFAVNIKAISQNAHDHDADGTYWDLVHDVTVWGNAFSDCSGLFQLCSATDYVTEPDFHRVEVAHNTALVPDTGYNALSGHEFGLQIGGQGSLPDVLTNIVGRPRDVDIHHNTFILSQGTKHFTFATNVINSGPRAPLTRYRIRDNVVVFLSAPAVPYFGVSNMSYVPTDTDTNFRALPMLGVIYGPNAIIASGTTTPVTSGTAPDVLYTTTTAAGVNSDGTLTTSSPLRNAASDGTDMGANTSYVTTATASASTGL